MGRVNNKASFLDETRDGNVILVVWRELEVADFGSGFRSGAVLQEYVGHKLKAMILLLSSYENFEPDLLVNRPLVCVLFGGKSNRPELASANCIVILVDFDCLIACQVTENLGSLACRPVDLEGSDSGVGAEAESLLQRIRAEGTSSGDMPMDSESIRACGHEFDSGTDGGSVRLRAEQFKVEPVVALPSMSGRVECCDRVWNR